MSYPFRSLHFTLQTLSQSMLKKVCCPNPVGSSGPKPSKKYFQTFCLKESRSALLAFTKSCKNRFSNNLTISVFFIMGISFTALYSVFNWSNKLQSNTTIEAIKLSKEDI